MLWRWAGAKSLQQLLCRSLPIWLSRHLVGRGRQCFLACDTKSCTRFLRGVGSVSPLLFSLLNEITCSSASFQQKGQGNLCIGTLQLFRVKALFSKIMGSFLFF
jgi:hypothetical protein